MPDLRRRRLPSGEGSLLPGAPAVTPSHRSSHEPEPAKAAAGVVAPGRRQPRGLRQMLPCLRPEAWDGLLWKQRTWASEELAGCPDTEPCEVLTPKLRGWTPDSPAES